MSDTKNKTKGEWMRNYWRPMMAFIYMAVIIFDFIIAPVGWSLLQFYAEGGTVNLEWSPITLVSGGLFHAAMGAVLGVSAFTRGQEKIEQIRESQQFSTETTIVAQPSSQQDRNHQSERIRYEGDFDYDMIE